MDSILKKHVSRLPLYVFILGILITIVYVSSIWNVQESPGRSLAAFLMIPFYVGCVSLLTLLTWIVVKLFK